MILPDINLLVYAYNADAPAHRDAKTWWERCLNGSETVALPWVVILGFVRIMTSRRILENPMSFPEAIGHVRTWLDPAQTMIAEPGPRHLELVESLGHGIGAAGELTTDIHLAALAVELRATLHSNDSDFGRFANLDWQNPID